MLVFGLKAVAERRRLFCFEGALRASGLGPDARRRRGIFLLLVQKKDTKEKDTPGTLASRWSAPLRCSPSWAAAQLASFAAQNKLEQVLAESPQLACATRQRTWGPRKRLYITSTSAFDSEINESK